MVKTASENSTVKVHYTGSLDDGKVFDSSEGKDPFEFTLGKGMVIKGFNNGIVGMSEGQEKTIMIEPADGYGQHHDKLVQEIPLEQLKGVEVKPGVMLHLKSEAGHEAHGLVTKVDGGKATIDLNHPLAGKKLTFKVKLVEVVG